MKTKHTLKTAPKKGSSPLFNFRVTPEEMALIRKKARKHTKGNCSAWCKYAAIHLDPRPEDLR